MFKKFLARLGKGAATVDLRFEGRPYSANEVVQGEVLIQGGEVDQKINHLAAKLMMSVNTKQGTVTREVTTIPLSNAFTIFPKEQKVIPFTYMIPANLPVSRGPVSYYFDTHLDIDGGVDRTDLDRLIVEAPKDVQAVFQALEQLGFREKPSSGKLDTYGQEFAFFPTALFAGQVSEIELRFASEARGLHVWMEVDCRGAYREVEAKRELFLDQDTLQDAEELLDVLKQSIIEAVEQPHSFMHPFSYEQYGRHGHHGHGHHGSSVAGMIGGLAMGILGAMLLEEMMGEAMEAAGEAFGFEEEESGEEESGFGDFFGGDDEEF